MNVPATSCGVERGICPPGLRTSTVFIARCAGYADGMAKIRNTAAVAAAGAGLCWYRRRRSVQPDLTGKVVLITGGSRGLGFNLARAYGRAGAHVVICARNTEQVQHAAAKLQAEGLSATAHTCDVRDADAVIGLVDQVVGEHGRLDVAIANAGTLVVGPVVHITPEDEHEAMETMYWGMVHLARAAMPHLMQSPDGRFATIGSIGGKIPVPHLLPYTTAKAAAMMYTETLRASWGSRNVKIVTIVPGLMRTGSHAHATIKGRHALEYRWFGLLSVAPFSSANAEGATRRIVAAITRGDAEAIITWQAQLAARLFGVAPSAFMRVTAPLAKLLPSPTGAGGDERGRASNQGLDVPVLERRSRAARRASQPGDHP